MSNVWSVGSLINKEVIDNLTPEQIQMLTEMLKDI